MGDENLYRKPFYWMFLSRVSQTNSVILALVESFWNGLTLHGNPGQTRYSTPLFAAKTGMQKSGRSTAASSNNATSRSQTRATQTANSIWRWSMWILAVEAKRKKSYKLGYWDSLVSQPQRVMGPWKQPCFHPFAGIIDVQLTMMVH